MALANIMRGHYDIYDCWEGKDRNPDRRDKCTYWIGHRYNGDFVIFGADITGVITIEARGPFNTYKEARKYLKEGLRFKGRMRKVH